MNIIFFYRQSTKSNNKMLRIVEFVIKNQKNKDLHDQHNNKSYLHVYYFKLRRAELNKMTKIIKKIKTNYILN